MRSELERVFASLVERTLASRRAWSRDDDARTSPAEDDVGSDDVGGVLEGDPPGRLEELDERARGGSGDDGLGERSG